jgi:DNA repair photolyase
MPQHPPPQRGRGASANPPNRFEPLSYSRDPEWIDPEDPALETQFFKDTSRSIISYNDSPDVGFDASINPYRGCEHGCIYCLSGDTRILMADGTTRSLEDIRIGDSVYGTVRHGWYRRYVKTRVLAHWEVYKPAYRVTLEDGTCLIAGADHRFLTERGWKFVTGGEPGNRRRPHLTVHNKLMGTGAFAPQPPKTPDYKRGYLCGLIRGDGHLAFYSYERPGRTHGDQYQFRLALADDEALQRAALYLLDFGVATHKAMFQKASINRKSMSAILTHARRSVGRVEEVIAWPSAPSDDWCKGFLAGIYDAEGSYTGGILRISNTDQTIVKYITHCLERLGFACVTESLIKTRIRPVQVVRLCGGLREHLRLFHTVDPAIARKRDIQGQAVKSTAPLRVTSIEPLRFSLRLFDMTTGTGDFIANGIVSHNCYARPTHEYLGFSAGVDFESRILVKADAPELLRRELSSPRWKSQVLAISGVTDPYQPIERRLQLTRRCLQVLVEFRNPVVIITKNHLVTRDADLLGELARYHAARVFLSITTLDGSLGRVMEPRASHPTRRLAAIETLSQAGVPTGVLAAPVIPGLTDHELPAIITAAAQSGARSAGYVTVRLPHGVGPLFEQWLARHFPDRKDKVLHRIRAIRGGKLNDPRFGSRMRGDGIFAEQIQALFALACRTAGIDGRGPMLSTAAFRVRSDAQLSLFDER